MLLIGEEWKGYDSQAFMCYAKMKHLLRCIVCSEEPDTKTEFNEEIIHREPCMALLRCGHVVCKPADDKHTKMCLETLRDTVGSTAVSEDMVDAATGLSEETTGELTFTVSADDEEMTGMGAGMSVETTSEPGTSAEASAADDEEIRDIGARLNGETATSLDSGTDMSETRTQSSGCNTPVVNYTCPACDLVTTDHDISSLYTHMRGTMELHRKLESILVEGTRLEIACNTCMTMHKESAGAVFTEAVKVCTHCVPTRFFCKGVCAEDHGEKTSHELAPYDPSSHEWLAMITRAAWAYPSSEYDPSTDKRFERPFVDVDHPIGEASAAIKADAEASVQQPANPEPLYILEEYLELLKDIQWNISQHCEVSECQRKTLQALQHLCPVFSTASKEELAEHHFSSNEVHTFDKERIKIGVLYRQTAHLMFLEAITHIHAEMSNLWKWMLSSYLCLTNLMEYCFPLWRIPWTEDFVVPFNSLASHHPLRWNMKEVIDQTEKLQESDIMAQPDSKVVEVCMHTCLESEEWQYEGIKMFTYTKTRSKSPHMFQRSVQIADNLYAVSSDSELFLVRRSVYGNFVNYFFNSPETQSFGYGLWWDGRSLIATCIGTKKIAQWDFKTIEGTFIVRYSLHTINSKVLFARRDTIVEVSNRLCICYDKSSAGREILGDNTLQCFRLTTGMEINHQYPLTLFKPPTDIRKPRLINVSGSLPYVILRDDDRRDVSPTLYALANRSSTELSWYTLQFRFPQSDPIQGKVKTVWSEDSNTLCLILALNGIPTGLQTENEVHIKLTEWFHGF